MCLFLCVLLFTRARVCFMFTCMRVWNWHLLDAAKCHPILPAKQPPVAAMQVAGRIVRIVPKCDVYNLVTKVTNLLVTYLCIHLLTSLLTPWLTRLSTRVCWDVRCRFLVDSFCDFHSRHLLTRSLSDLLTYLLIDWLTSLLTHLLTCFLSSSFSLFCWPVLSLLFTYMLTRWHVSFLICWHTCWHTSWPIYLLTRWHFSIDI